MRLYAAGSNGKDQGGNVESVGKAGVVHPEVLLEFTASPQYAALDVVQAIPYYFSTCVLLADGSTLTTGGQQDAQQCNGNYGGHPPNIGFHPQIFPQRTKLPLAKQLDGFGAHIIALLQDNRVGYWGGNLYGTAGNGASAHGVEPPWGEAEQSVAKGLLMPLPIYPELPNEGTPIAVATGYHQSAVLFDSGLIAVCGDNKLGGLGTGNEVDSYVFAHSDIEGVRQISCGGDFLIAVKTDNTAWSCGANQQGQRGIGATSRGAGPVWEKVLLPGPCVAAATGNRHSLFLLENGDVYRAGVRTGTPERENFHDPTPVKIAAGAKAIAGGEETTYIILESGPLIVNGQNPYGQLGDGTRTPKPGFEQLDFAPSAIAGGEIHALALAA